MARVSSQWPRTMIVINDASSHQTSISKRPKVAASDVPKATMIAQADEGHHAGLAVGKFTPMPHRGRLARHKQRRPFQGLRG